MGLFGSLFGGSKSSQVQAPTIPQFQIDAKSTNTANRLMDLGLGQIETSTGLNKDILGLLPQLEQAPKMGEFEQTELANAENTFGSMLELARINSLNDTARSLQGTASQFGLAGGAFGGSGQRALTGAITGANQKSLNEYAMQTSNNLLGMRANLLSGVYQRLMNRFNATLTTQGQLQGQGTALTGTGLGFNFQVAQAKSGVDVANANLKSQANMANQQASLQSQSNAGSIFGGLVSTGASLFGKFLGGS
jgi:hypothetical protein